MCCLPAFEFQRKQGHPPSPKPGGEHGAESMYIEIFSWKTPDAPQTAHQTPEVMAVWEPMGALCEHMDFPEFEVLDLED